MSRRSASSKHDNEGYESENGPSGPSSDSLFARQSLLGNFILLHHKGHAVLVQRPTSITHARLEAMIAFALDRKAKIFLSIKVRKLMIEIKSDAGWKAVAPFSSSVFVSVTQPLALHWKNVELKDVAEKSVSAYQLKHETLKDLRDRIERVQHIPRSDQCLVLSGVRIDDSKTLAEIGVTPSTKIYVGSYSKS